MASCSPATTSYTSIQSGAIKVRPLTTVFTPPEGCGAVIQSYACGPPDMTYVFGFYGGAYSPGICPVGYTIGCEPWRSEARSRFSNVISALTSGSPDWPFLPTAGETDMMCVPS